MPVDYLQKILTAKVYDVAIETPLELAPILSRRLGNRVLLKREDQQPVFSFKLRGAYNKMAHLTSAERARGVIAASAGNHAQGVALAAQKLHCKATIVMPVTTPHIKIAAVEARGAKVVLIGDSYSDAYAHAMVLQKASRATFVHPYDDPDVIAGQGTIGMEILRQCEAPIDAIFVAVGGGGLIGGIASYVKRVRPEIRIIGVQPVDSDAMTRSLAAGRRVKLAQVGERREAILAVTIPERPGSFRAFCRHLGKRSVTEFNYRYADASVAHLFVGIEVTGRAETERLLTDLKRHRIEAYDLTDNEMAKLHVRHLVGGHAPDAEHEILYRFEFPERPGALMQFLNSMSRGWNISLFHYRNHGADYGRVLVGMQVPPSDHAEFQRFLGRLGYRYVDESANPAYRLFLGR